MKIHYFFNREHDKGFYDLVIEAWLEEKETSMQGVERLSFTRLEKLRIFLSRMIISIAMILSMNLGKIAV